MARQQPKHSATRSRGKRTWLLGGAVLAAVVGSVIAVNAAPTPVPTIISTGKAVSQVRVIADENAGFNSSTNGGDGPWANMPTMVTTVSVPSTWGSGLLVMTLSADSSCYGAPHECGLRILVDGQVAGPKAEEFALETGFDSTTGTDPFGTDVATFEAHAMQRSVVVGPGSHTIQVQAAALNGTCATSACQVVFYLRNWQLTILKSRVT